MPTSNKPRGFSITCKASGEAEILLYEEIDSYWGVGAKQFRDQLKAAGDLKTIRLRINSQGGNILEGLAIYNTLKDHPAKVIVSVDGMALSMGSVVAMAGDEIEIAENAWMMIHNPVNYVFGEAEEMRKSAELLDSMKTQLVNIYAKRSKQDASQIAAWMDDETWFSGTDAVSKGFADRNTGAVAMAACVDPKRFQHIPTALSHSEGVPLMSQSQENQNKPAAYQDLKAAFPKASAEFLTSQLDASATLDQARAAYQTQLEKRAEEAEAKAAAEAKARAEAKATAAGKKPGVPPIPDGGNATGSQNGDADPIAAWNDLVANYAKQGLDKGKAIAKAVREHPEAHEAFLAAWNEANRRERR
jgi:ATP-dependent Clp endopeptidase proteolytic subunit ClpP